MLPTIQESLKLGRRNRFNFPAKLAEREPVDARQNSPVAPFHFAFRERRGISPAHDLAFRFEFQESRLNLIQRKGQDSRE